MSNEAIDNLPKVNIETLKQVNKIIVDKIQGDEIMPWALKLFEELRKNNSVLYEFIMDNANKFVAGVVQSNPAEIIASKILSDLILLFLVNQAFKRQIDLQKWEESMGKLLNGIDFGENK